MKLPDLVRIKLLKMIEKLTDTYMLPPTLQIQILLQWWGEQRAVVIWASPEVLQKSCLLK